MSEIVNSSYLVTHLFSSKAVTFLAEANSSCSILMKHDMGNRILLAYSRQLSNCTRPNGNPFGTLIEFIKILFRYENESLVYKYHCKLATPYLNF